MLIWCLKQVKDFTLNFLINKIIKFTIYNTIYEMLMRLSLIEEIMKDVTSVCISFDIKDSQALGNSE